MTKMKNRPCIYDFPGVKLYGKPWWGDTGKASVPGAPRVPVLESALLGP